MNGRFGVWAAMWAFICSGTVSVPAQVAGIAALKETEYVEATLKLIPKERGYLFEALTGR